MPGSGASRREGWRKGQRPGERHCEERKRRSNPGFLVFDRIASRSLSSGAHSRDPLARGGDFLLAKAVQERRAAARLAANVGNQLGLRSSRLGYKPLDGERKRLVAGLKRHLAVRSVDVGE